MADIMNQKKDCSVTKAKSKAQVLPVTCRSTHLKIASMKHQLVPGLLALLLCSSSGLHAQAAKPVKQPAQMERVPVVRKTVEVELPTTGPLAQPTPNSGPVESGLAKARRAAYVIGPEDVLMIKVWQEPNLSGSVTVGPDGMISLQLIDEVRADGLTTEQLKRVLTDRLKNFIKEPDVNVQVLRVNSRKFIIQGEVSRPGSFPLTGPTTMMEALVSAGGFREFANPKKIYLLRTETDPQTKKPETKKFDFNYKDVSHGKKMEQNILIQNGDQIFVP